MTRKILAVLLALAMVFTLCLTACGGEDAAATSAADTSAADDAADTTASTEEAAAESIHWYFRSNFDNTPDWADYVWPELQSMIQEAVNVTVEPHPFASADYATKFAAAITSGTDIDLMFMNAGGTDFYPWYERNALCPLNDLLNEYAPGLVEAMPDYAFNAATIDGQIYGMPTIKDLCVDIGFFYNQTMLENSGLQDKWDAIDFENAKDFDEIFHEMKAYRDGADASLADIPLVDLYTTEWAYYKADELTAGIFAKIEGVDSFEDKADGEIFKMFETQDFKDAVTLTHNWVVDGINPYDASNYKRDDHYKPGYQFGCWTWGNICADPDQYAEYGWTLALRHPNAAFTYTLYPLYCFHAISALTTEEKQVASMKVFNLLAQDPEFATTLRFGVEGTHWEKVEKDGVTRANFDFEGSRNADSAQYNYYFWYFAEVGNLTTTYLPITEQDEFFQIMEDTNNNALTSKYMGFLLVTTDITNEIAACANVIGQFKNDLFLGMVDDIDGTIDTFNSTLVANGMDNILAECQEQTTAWLG